MLNILFCILKKVVKNKCLYVLDCIKILVDAAAAAAAILFQLFPKVVMYCFFAVMNSYS